MLKRFATFLLVILALASVGQALAQGKVQLTIESWRNDDLKIWRDTIIPAFTG
jgi:raffinose/stachyose/melibiose transport system substrate-binding protein